MMHSTSRMCLSSHWRSPRDGASRQPCSLGTLGLAGVLLVLGGCSSTTLFQSSFNSQQITTPPSAPAPNQAVGTVSVASGTVTIVGPLPNVSGNWAQLTNSGGVGQTIASMLCNFSQQGAGTYSLTAVLYIPDGKQAATVELGLPGPSFTGFMHLDFGPDNRVHVNDGATFGTFPRNQPFTLSLTLTAGASATAHIQLFGTGASGSMDVTSGIPGSLAQQFGAVNFWMGVQYAGSYQVQNILVTYKK